MWAEVTAALNIAFQLRTVASEDFGGLSGQDSIIQAFVATFDASTGLLFTLAACHFVFDRTPVELFNLPHWRLLHSKPDDTHEQIKISFRPSPWHLTQKVDRVGRLYWKDSSEDNPENETWVTIKFANNLSIFVVPFLKQVALVDESQGQQIVLDELALWHAAADSLVRLLCFITVAISFFLTRIALYTVYTSNWKISLVIALFELLRTFTVIAQEISILTYSCAYKGIRTWAWPAKPAMLKDSPVAASEIEMDSWTSEQRRRFERLVWQQMSLVNPARGLFWIMTGFRRCEADGTPSVFNTWATPPSEVFINESSSELLLKVFEPNLQVGEEKLIQTVRFKNVPYEIIRSLRQHLSAEPVELRLGVLYLISSVANIVLPALFLAFHPNELVRVYYSFEQIAAQALRYYDPKDLSINTKLKAIPQPYPCV